MRSYFVESEIARGTRSLTFYGGTPHSMQHAFLHEEATDLIVRRRSWKAGALTALARAVGFAQRRIGNMNFVVEILCNRDLRWQAPMGPAQRQAEEAALVETLKLRAESKVSVKRVLSLPTD